METREAVSAIVGLPAPRCDPTRMELAIANPRGI